MSQEPTPTDQIIELLDTDPHNWCQDAHWLSYRANGNTIDLWTPIALLEDGVIIRPKRQANLLERFRLWRAVRRWHKRPLNLGGCDEAAAIH